MCSYLEEEPVHLSRALSFAPSLHPLQIIMKSRGSKDVRLGCAGWSLSKEWADQLGSEGSHLKRYASHFNSVEINSTFYKSHRQATYSRWAKAVPEDFRFSVKIPKMVTHQKKLKDTTDDLTAFLSEVEALGNKLEVFLVQLPPTLTFDSAVIEPFFATFRSQTSRSIACEPRHLSWFTDQANKMLARFQIARVAADPAIVPEAAEPAGWNQFAYYRLHGSPRKYYSSYDSEYLAVLSRKLQLRTGAKESWCIFDNTASGAALENANSVLQQLQAE